MGRMWTGVNVVNAKEYAPLSNSLHLILYLLKHSHRENCSNSLQERVSPASFLALPLMRCITLGNAHSLCIIWTFCYNGNNMIY